MTLHRIAGACASAVARLAVVAEKLFPPAGRSRTWAVGFAALAAMLAAGWAFATTYTYDSNGRLNGVTNDSGVTARYAYDALGNITQITRPSSSTVVIYAFSPGRGAPGTVVTIQGNGFSTTASQDVLTFNGVAATVTAATTSQLTATVPATAATGPLSVTVGSQTAASSTNFIVDSAAVAPKIASFSPVVGTAGTVVTLNGSGLYPVPYATNLYMNQTTAVPTSLASSKIVFPVPPVAGSGKITVTTPYGLATSSQDFIDAPPGISASAISSYSSIAVGAAPKSLTVNTAGQYAGELFDGTPGQWLTIQFGSLTTTVDFTVYDPHNNVFLSGGVSATSPTVHLPQLSLPGTYLLLMTPTTAPATWTAGVEQAPTLVPGAAALAIPTTGVAQSKRYVVVVPSNLNLDVGVSNMQISTGGYVNLITVYGPGGNQLYTNVCYPGQAACDVNLRDQPAGTYTLVVGPQPGATTTMSFSILLTADAVAALPLNTATAMNITRNGQEGDYSFTATQGQTLVLNVANLTALPSSGCGGIVGATFEILMPDGTTYSGPDGPGWVASGSTETYTLPFLSQGGTYQLFIDPACGETATGQLTMATGSGATLALDGSAVNFTTNNPQISYMQFTLPANATVGLGLTPNLAGGAGLPYRVNVYNASNTLVTGPVYCQTAGGCILGFWDLPAGTYTAQASANGGTLGFSALLSSNLVVPLQTGKVTAVSTSRAGQIANVNFTATQGQNVALQIGVPTTTPSGSGISVSVYAPGAVPGVNSPLTSVSTTTATTINLPSVAATGTYLAYTYGSPNGATFSTTMQLTETAGTASTRRPSTMAGVSSGTRGRTPASATQRTGP